jgi:glutamate-5-semialdehyde dehydrogenase
MKMDIREKAIAARKAFLRLSSAETSLKNAGLSAIRKALESRAASIFEANTKDLEAAIANNLPTPLIKRLKFDKDKLAEVCAGIESLKALPDPVGKRISARELDEGFELYQVTCPIGVIGLIFESRPDALVQISTLCLKSGNAVILKGGSDAAETNRVLANIIDEATTSASIPEGWIQLAETRAEIGEMLKLDSLVDLIIPRGSNEFVKYVMDNTNIHVLGHADGICHAYIHADAESEIGVSITVDSKTQYVAVCNALETLLVHRDAAESFLPRVKAALEEKGVRLKGCERTRAIIQADPAEEIDWKTEYLDLVLSIKVVDGFDEAVEHINSYGSHHTDTIVTKEKSTADRFMHLVDSANVFWNCSTRFSDGFRFGLGAEVGVGTGKIHARGPVGMEGLLIYKWKLYGKGQIVSDYAGPGAKPFSHRSIEDA